MIQAEYSRQIIEVGEEIHVPKTVDCNEGEILLRFPQMMKWMSELCTVRRQKRNAGRFGEQFPVNN